MEKLTAEQKKKVKYIRQECEKQLKMQIDALIEVHTDILNKSIRIANEETGAVVPSYLKNNSKPWTDEDSKGFVTHFCILRLMDKDPSGDFDGYNRWEEFEDFTPEEEEEEEE